LDPRNPSLNSKNETHHQRGIVPSDVCIYRFGRLPFAPQIGHEFLDDVAAIIVVAVTIVLAPVTVIIVFAVNALNVVAVTVVPVAIFVTWLANAAIVGSQS
jgi:hypothetical protein